MPIHVQVWSAAGNATITDMANAGKRGKTCTTLQFRGWCNSGTLDADARRCHDMTISALDWLRSLDASAATLDEVDAELNRRIAAARLPENYGIGVYEDAIRAVDAPRPILTAGNGKWRGSLDNDGVSLADLTDHYNEPRECTFGQTAGQAYKLAAKVWPQVQHAETMHEASQALRAAGCKLHYWCAVD